MHNYYIIKSAGWDDRTSSILHECKIDEIIDYLIITERLIKKDRYKKLPSPRVISTEIFNQLEETYKKEFCNCLYKVSSIDPDVIESIKGSIDYLSKKYNKESNVFIIKTVSKTNIEKA